MDSETADLRCPSCQKPVAHDARFCSACGERVEPSWAAPTMDVRPDASAPAVGGLAGGGRARSGTTGEESGSGGFAPGTILGRRYRIVARLGRGGMGIVYRADDLKLGQPVALKFLPRSVERDPAWLEALFAEVRNARQVSHPNVCRVFDVTEIEGRHVLSMEYVDGEDLASLLRRIGRLPKVKATEVAQQLCAGLAAAHERGVIHRDLKPANVMLDGAGRARITDFGLAIGAGEQHRAGETAGTPLYMAPEQRRGEGASVRSDLYSLGLVLYELATGTRAFEAASAAELLELQLAGPAPPSNRAPDLDPAFEQATLQCLAADPAARPPSALGLAAMLPGGDPLAAAVAAGQTPSPEMVAAAGTAGGLRLQVGWGLLGAFAVAVAACVLLAPRTTLLGLARPQKAPEALAERARDLVVLAGFSAHPADSAYWLDAEGEEVSRWLAGGANAGSSEDEGRARLLRFTYRQSPRPLVSSNPLHGLSRVNPAMDVPGMVTVQLDGSGRLLALGAVPPTADAGERGGRPDWGPFLAAAGLDPSSMEEVSPTGLPQVPFDDRREWRVEAAAGLGVASRVRAASWGEVPVLLEVAEADEGTGARSTTGGGGTAWVLGVLWNVMGFSVLGAAAYFARRNLRLGRGDPRGALRLAVCLASLRLAQHVLTSHLAFGSPWRFFFWFRTLSGSALFSGLLIWLLYVALEPYARRRLPRLMIGWSRALAGRFRDPLVGRDLLAGATVGAWTAAVSLVAPAAISWAVGGAPCPSESFLDPLLGLRHLVGSALGSFLFQTAGVVGVTGILAVGWVVTRHRAPAIVFATLVLFAGFTASAAPWAPLPVALVGTVLLTAVLFMTLLRLGALAALAAMTVCVLLTRYPIDLQGSGWVAATSLQTLGLVGALAAYGFARAIAGRPVLGEGVDRR